jgi:hypothetical protein
MDGRRAAGARTRTSAGELAAREGATGADAAADAAADGPLTGAVEGADRPSTTAAFRDPGF